MDVYREGYWGYSPALSAISANYPNLINLSKIWRKAGDSNAYVPKDPGLAGQWDTSYPSLPKSYKTLDLGFINYRRDTKSVRL